MWTKDDFFVIIYIIIHNTVIVYNLSLLSYLFKVKYCISFIWGKEKSERDRLYRYIRGMDLKREVFKHDNIVRRLLTRKHMGYK